MQLNELAEQLKEGGGAVVTKAEEIKQARERVNTHVGQRLLTRENTNFASKSIHSSGQYVWWFDIFLERTSRDLHLLLKRAMKDDAGGMIWLKLPANTLSMEGFGYRKIKGKNAIVLEIGTQGINYLKDIRSGGVGYDFASHVQHEFPAAGPG